MLSREIRDTFFAFFGERGHIRVPSSPLIPSDPTLLLANAGMNQFKPYFLGEAVPDSPRAMTVQKCARTSDIDNVGRTTRHATFFEMLGNFSFGDYFKAEAIAWAWELFTEGYGLDPERLWITVYLDDDESARIWRSIGVPAERIHRLGVEDNYWSMGVPGPCGPSSELCYDRGPAFGAEGGPAVNDERYVELWNLVFMEKLRGEGPAKKDYAVLGDLQKKNIDTGLGLDRLAAILQGVDTVCQTDLLAPTLEATQELAGRRFPGHDGSPESVSFQVVTEHARSIAFLIADGVLPSNEGRGYILRRLMRRVVRHARLLGIDRPVLAEVTASVVGNLGEDWPELTTQSSLIEQVVSAEEETFNRTLRQGTRLLEAAIERARDTGSSSLSGDTAFELHDTYGFPVDLTTEAAGAAGLEVDQERFTALLEEQQRRAKQSGKERTGAALARLEAYRHVAARFGSSEFVGYDTTTAESTIAALIVGGDLVEHADEGQEVEVVLHQTPFYAESGGQVGDAGVIRSRDGALVEVRDTRAGVVGLTVHKGRVTSGTVRIGEEVRAEVDPDRRTAVARSHSATHVLHAMLRRTLGDHARQQGSLVAPGRLRFDFAHFSALDQDRIDDISTLINEAILDEPEVRVWHTSRAEAEAAGAMALFGEKYGDVVRVVDIGDFSRELCGGTHVDNAAAIGPVHILSESSIGSSLRRIEALTGRDALRHFDRERMLLNELTGLLGVGRDAAVDTLTKRLSSLADAEKKFAEMRRRELEGIAERLAGRARASGGGWLVVSRVDEVERDELRTVAASVLQRRGASEGVVVLATEAEGKAALTVAMGNRLAENGTNARDLLTRAAAMIGGGAGGRGTTASAGGRQVEHLDEALRAAREEAEARLGSL
ncbi:alanyl-tRNA synthetase [Marinactinospora thermotolerans DSM 45154]|uniref:Alanine--tRNA ligase n=1 Tax=Marinactinospora thermotolerans DSM 45154 TaxID=1122192 RepID=A0A1T4KMU5_9ACTN|nr:alanine--tRNA ligase [Marinactinospora thermotolerans]SJZ43693.1 alanyl-tRNA synthetase [Marinactinospora thermotolerans DSM 45154]